MSSMITDSLKQEILQAVSAATPPPSPSKFPFTLPDRSVFLRDLLIAYGKVVSNRGGDFLLDDCTLSKAEKVTRWFYDSPKSGLILTGTFGNGKTTMLRALNTLTPTHSTLFVARNLYNYYSTNQKLPSLIDNGILLIDDIGEEPPTVNIFGDERRPIQELLMQRYTTNAFTIFSTNLVPDEILAHYGPRFFDRMKEQYAMICYTEPSYRK